MNERENWLYPDASGLYFIHDGFIMRATDGKQYDIEEECDLLNEQQAEIMRLIIQLKCINQIKPSKKEIPDSIDIVISNDVELLQNLTDENKKLKTENKKLKEQLKNLRRLVNEAYMEGSE